MVLFWIFIVSLIAAAAVILSGFAYGLWQERAHLRAIRRANRQDGELVYGREISSMTGISMIGQVELAGRRAPVEFHGLFNSQAPLQQALLSQQASLIQQAAARQGSSGSFDGAGIGQAPASPLQQAGLGKIFEGEGRGGFGHRARR